MGAPLRADGKGGLGVLHVGTLSRRSLQQPEDVDLLQVAADRAAVAVPEPWPCG